MGLTTVDETAVPLASAQADERTKRLAARARRRRIELLGERAMETVIRLCGVSAILFVFGIFIFVFREGAPLLFNPKAGFSLVKFLASPEWYPTSVARPRYGTAAL